MNDLGEFRCDHISTTDVERFGCPIEVAISQTIEKNPRYGVNRSEIGSVQDRVSHWHITWLSGSDFKYLLG